MASLTCGRRSEGDKESHVFDPKPGELRMIRLKEVGNCPGGSNPRLLQKTGINCL